MADSQRQYKHSNLEDGRQPKMIRMNQSYEQQYEENEENEEPYSATADGSQIEEEISELMDNSFVTENDPREDRSEFLRSFLGNAHEMFQTEVSNFYSAVTSMEAKEKEVLMQMENKIEETRNFNQLLQEKRDGFLRATSGALFAGPK